LDRVFDLGRLREEARAASAGPTVVQAGRLMQEARVNLAIRWFIGCRSHDARPGHSNLTRVRQRRAE